MPPRSWRVRIEDILEAMDNREDYWQTIQEDLPAIKPLLRQVLASPD
jgi:uncharacterized protein with HEPN domain